MVPLTVPSLGEEEVRAVTRVLESGMLVQGPEVASFEEELAAQSGRAQAVAVVNGTAALELALRALDIGRGDEVLCPALTWPSPLHAVLAVGAEPVLVDVDGREWNATEEGFARARSARTRAAIVIEQFGNPARHERIAASLPGVSVVVDAACSLGSRYAGAPCGSHGRIACTSFHPRKVITTGEGGACLTDDPALAERLRVLRNHGQGAPGMFACASVNLRMTDMMAALGRVQLAKLDALCDARRALFARLREQLPQLVVQEEPAQGQCNRQTLGVLVGPAFAGSAARDRAIAALGDLGVAAGRLSYALGELPHLAPLRAAASARGLSLEVSKDLAERGLALPLFPGMSEAQLAQVASAARVVLR